MILYAGMEVSHLGYAAKVISRQNVQLDRRGVPMNVANKTTIPEGDSVVIARGIQIYIVPKSEIRLM